MDVDGFILSQKSKLADEKSRLAARGDRKPRGIIPTESSAILRNDQLRRERLQEYNQYLEDREVRNPLIGGRRDPPGKSVAEIRHDLSRQREKEITQNERKLRSGESKRRRDDYSSSRDKELSDDRQYRAKRLAEERRYREHSHGQLFTGDGDQKNKGGGERQGSSKVSFEKDWKEGRYSSWDEEEDDLMKWTRNQAYKTSNRLTSGSRKKAQTPPGVDSPRLLREHSKASLRSISAPSVAPPAGIAALGANDDNSQLKRLQQLRYAEELRHQIEEKREEKLQRGPRIKEGGLGYTPAADKPPRRSKQDEERFNEESRDDDKHWGYRPGHKPRDDRRRQGTPPRRKDVASDQRRHPRYSDYEEGEDEDRAQRKPRRNSSSRYGYYHDPYDHPPPPPPPPRYQGGGYNRWGAPYYSPYPPPPNPSHHGPGYHTPYADIYFPSYHPHHPNPYAPPLREPRPPSREYWEDRGQGRDHGRDERSRNKGQRERNLSPPRRRDDKENSLSPIFGASENKSKMDKDTYRLELKQQMQEKKERDLKEKAAKEKYEKNIETEIYDPFGKGGCGAPVRDQFGNLVADLKQMRKINENRLSGNSPINLRLSKDSARENPLTPVDVPDASPRNTILTYDKQTTEDMKKTTQENYREYLRQQVKEKEELKQKEKERQKLEEQKELEQLERDRKRLQEEYQQELERQKKKEQEARNKNEAIKREAELKRQMAIMREEEERRAQAEKRLSKNVSSFNMSEVRRADSPPVPALRKMKQLSNPPLSTPGNSNQEDFRSSSPPVPALRKKKPREHIEPVTPAEEQEERRVESSTRQRGPTPTPVHRELSATQRQEREEPLARPTKAEEELSSEAAEAEQRMLLTQLGAIRMHLQAELAKQTGQHQSSDIFEKAKRQKPKIVASRLSKPRESALNALGEFNKLKYGQSSQQRGGKFYEDFPGVPEDEHSLESQQSALLRHQNEMIKAAQQRVEGARGRGRKMDPEVGPSLSAQTAHLDVDSSGIPLDIPLDDDLLENIEPTRRRSQQQKPRGNWDRGVSPSGSRFSVSTQDVDSMAARNEERLQRLEAILNAGGPGPNRRQPSSVSAQFLAPKNAPRTRNESRQSERSLQCDVQHLPTAR